VRTPLDTPLQQPDANARDLAAEVVRDAQRLVSLEIALARQEIKDMVVANAVAAGMVAVGGLVLVLGALVAVPVLAVVLVPWHWQAVAIWIILYVLFGIGLALAGKARFAVRLPARTLASLKENKEWALRQMRSTGR
jgi:hypothetical protein